MIQKDPIFLWKARLLKKVYNFGAVAGFFSLSLSSYFLLQSGYYAIIGIYLAAYLSLLTLLFVRNISLKVKVHGIILITYTIGSALLLLNGNLSAGLIWLFSGLFFAAIFLDRKRLFYYGMLSGVVITLHILDIYTNFIPWNFYEMSREYKLIKYLNSFVFIVAAAVYANEEMISGIAKAVKSERNIREELNKEKTKLEGLNSTLKSEMKEKEGYKKNLENLNLTLNEKVNEQTKQLQSALNDLKEEVEERKKTETELKNTKEDLLNVLHQEKALNELKSKFIAMISHEYRTPLTVIMNSTYLLDKYFETQNKEKFDDSIEKINESINDMTHLLEEVIKFGKVQKDATTVKLADFNLNDKIEDVIRQVTSDISHSHHIIFNKNGKMPVKTDVNHLHYILRNVLKNAVQYSEPNTDIVVETNRKDDNIIIKVKDKGIGISEEDNEKIFEPFYRGENTTGMPGTGLGLSISGRYAETIGAEISFIKNEDKGTTFNILLPAGNQD